MRLRATVRRSRHAASRIMVATAERRLKLLRLLAGDAANVRAALTCALCAVLRAARLAAPYLVPWCVRGRPAPARAPPRCALVMVRSGVYTNEAKSVQQFLSRYHVKFCVDSAHRALDSNPHVRAERSCWCDRNARQRISQELVHPRASGPASTPVDGCSLQLELRAPATLQAIAEPSHGPALTHGLRGARAIAVVGAVAARPPAPGAVATLGEGQFRVRGPPRRRIADIVQENHPLAGLARRPAVFLGGWMRLHVSLSNAVFQPVLQLQRSSSTYPQCNPHVVRTRTRTCYPHVCTAGGTR
jgi:hypothetical protein